MKINYTKVMRLLAEVLQLKSEGEKHAVIAGRTECENKQLQMEVTVLRAFLRAAERRSVCK